MNTIQTVNPAPVPVARSGEAVRVPVGPKKIKSGAKGSSAGGLPALAPAPHSDKALRFRDDLVDAGMSSQGATDLASGKFDGVEVSTKLNKSDQNALAKYLLARLDAMTNET